MINLLLIIVQGKLSNLYIYYHIILSVWYLLSTHFLRYVIKKQNWIQTKIKYIIHKVFISVFILAIINNIVHLIVWSMLGALNYEYDLDIRNIGFYTLASVFIYFLWIFTYLTFQYVERYNTALKYEALKNEIELNNLKSQLNPHFIFNSLNSIRALVDEDPEKSKDAITRLSSILRNSLVRNRNKFTTFSEEIHSVYDYLDLETIRFEERLQSRFEIDPKCGNFKVPPMMIQTLVENGIKHGISKLKDGGEISLEAKMDGSFLDIKIRNTGQLKEERVNGSTGFGLENTKQRLNLLYGNDATFIIKNENGSTVLTEVRLPQEV